MTDSLVHLAVFIEKVRAIAGTGIAFNQSGYNFHRYQELLETAAQLEALLAGLSPQDGREMAALWQSGIAPGRDGYVTTAVGCGGIVFNQRDELLLMERTDGGWWYPAGWYDVGYLPAEVVVKEVREETGLIVEPRHLMGVFDSRLDGNVGRHYVSLLFECELLGGSLRPDPLEAKDAGFFAFDALPGPFHNPNPRFLEVARRFHFEGLREPFFDPIKT